MAGFGGEVRIPPPSIRNCAEYRDAPSEQYGLTWARVDLVRKQITTPKSKNGKARHIPLNSAAIAAFKLLQQTSLNATGPVFVTIHGKALRGYKHWFDPAVKEAGIRDFTWYCLRHTFARRLVMVGVGLRTVADLMGQDNSDDDALCTLSTAHQHAAVERLVLKPAVPAGPSDNRSATTQEAVYLTVRGLSIKSLQNV